LGKIGGWKVVEELLQLLKGENPNMRMAAASALGETGDGHALLDLVWTQYNDFAPTSWGQSVADAAAEAVHKIEERRKG
jgi:HEAT repeat protein